MTPQEEDFSATAAEAKAFVEHFSPEARVVRAFPGLPNIEHRVEERLRRYDHDMDHELLRRAVRIQAWRDEGVPYLTAVAAAHEAEKRPTYAEIQQWKASRR